MMRRTAFPLRSISTEAIAAAFHLFTTNSRISTSLRSCCRYVFLLPYQRESQLVVIPRRMPVGLTLFPILVWSVAFKKLFYTSYKLQILYKYTNPFFFVFRICIFVVQFVICSKACNW